MGVLAKDNSQFLSYLTLNNRDVERSLQVIQTATIRKLGCGFLCAFHGRIFNRLWDIQRQKRDLENGIRGYSRSLNMAPFDGLYTTFYWYDIVNIALSCKVFDFFDVE